MPPSSLTLRQRNARVLDKVKGKVLHPESRKVQQMRRAMRHNVKTDVVKERQELERRVLAERCSWVREALTKISSGSLPEGPHVIAALANIYIERGDAEIAALKKARNPKRGRIGQLDARRVIETDQITSTKGLLMPVIHTEEGMHALLSGWDGSPGSVGKVKLEGVTRAGRSSEEQQAVQKLVEEFRSVLGGDVPSLSAAPERSIALRRNELRKKLNDARVQNKSVKAALGSVRSDEATGRRAASQLKAAAYRRHKQLAMSRGLL